MANVTVEPDSLALALTSETPDVAWDSSVLPDTFALALTQEVSTVLFPIQTILPSTLALALTQEASSLSFDALITPTTLELALTLQTATIISNVEIVLADVLNLSLALQVPTIALPLWTILPDTFALEADLPSPYAIIGYAEITPAMHAALIDPYSGGAWLWLVEISILGYEIIRLARNTEDVIYAYNLYEKNNFNIGLAPLISDSSVPQIILRIAQDADYTLEDKINATQGAGGGQVKIIRTHEDFLTEFIEELEQTVDILTSNSDTEYVTFLLGISNPLMKKIPSKRYSSKLCSYARPALFKGVECQYAGSDSVCTGSFEDCYVKGNSIHWGAELGLDPNTIKV